MEYIERLGYCFWTELNFIDFFIPVRHLGCFCESHLISLDKDLQYPHFLTHLILTLINPPIMPPKDKKNKTFITI